MERNKHKISKAESNSNSLAISRVWIPLISTKVGKWWDKFEGSDAFLVLIKVNSLCKLRPKNRNKKNTQRLKITISASLNQVAASTPFSIRTKKIKYPTLN